MTKYLLALGVFCLQAAALDSANCKHGVDSFKCVSYAHNYDGDTFTVNIASVHPLIGQAITVRVLGIDAAEMTAEDSCEKSAALRAKQEAQEMLSGAKRIDLTDIKRDKYFRVLAEVKVDGKSLAEHMIDRKLAVPYDGRTKKPVDWCRN